MEKTSNKQSLSVCPFIHTETENKLRSPSFLPLKKKKKKAESRVNINCFHAIIVNENIKLF